MWLDLRNLACYLHSEIIEKYHIKNIKFEVSWFEDLDLHSHNYKKNYTYVHSYSFIYNY